MKKQKDKYTKILLWAYKKQDTGFTWEELKQECSLSDSEESWVKKIFNTTDDGDRKFVEHFRNDDSVEPNVHYYSLNEKGISAALSAIESKKLRRNNFVTGLIAVGGLIISILSLNSAIQTGKLTQRSVDDTHYALELTAQPTVSLSVENDEYGFIKFASSTINFTLKNTSLTNYRDLHIDISLFQTYYNFLIGKLIVGPVAQFSPESDGIFKTYSFPGSVSSMYNSFPLLSSKELNFKLDPFVLFDSLAKKGMCPFETNEFGVYHKKFKYFIRVDIHYSREIDNANYSYTKYYSLDSSGVAIDLARNKEGLHWII
ncbi:MAG: hypothetical protein WC790_01875, partial [Candidatus Paceibacterota bacterium]